jgi:hypothetical protein
MNKERVAASVVSPKDDKQEIHGGARTDKVGQRHWLLGEQNEMTSATLEHSKEQISTEGNSRQIEAALTRSDETVEAAVISPKDAKQDTHGGPTTGRDGQIHCAFEEHAEKILVMLPHSSEQTWMVATSGQSWVMMDAMDEASGSSPKPTKQETHGGPTTDNVGQMHCGAEEHAEKTLVTLAHSERQMQSVLRYEDRVAAPETSPFSDKQS